MNKNIAETFYNILKIKMIYKLNHFARSENEHIANQRGRLSDLAWKAIEEEVVAKLGCKKTDKIIEIGCGTGLLCNAISEKFRTYIGFDLIFDLVSRAKRNNISENILFMQANGKTLPIKEKSIDRILFYSVIIYLPPVILRDILRECKRVLKPEGFMLLGDIPNTERINHFLKKKYNSNNKMKGSQKIHLIAFRTKKGIQKTLNIPGGGWYKPSEIKRILFEEGFDCFLSAQGKRLPYSYYRYDCFVSHSKDQK